MGDKQALAALRELGVHKAHPRRWTRDDARVPLPLRTAIAGLRHVLLECQSPVPRVLPRSEKRGDESWPEAVMQTSGDGW